jgi:hypothetical protein
LSAGKTEDPKGVYDSRDGRSVRVCDRFTLVGQNEQGDVLDELGEYTAKDTVKERKRSQGGVQIIVDRQVSPSRFKTRSNLASVQSSNSLEDKPWFQWFA